MDGIRWSLEIGEGVTEMEGEVTLPELPLLPAELHARNNGGQKWMGSGLEGISPAVMWYLVFKVSFCFIKNYFLFLMELDRNQTIAYKTFFQYSKILYDFLIYLKLFKKIK